MSLVDLTNLFKNEFEYCQNKPNERIYFLAFANEKLVANAGARFYDQKNHENMYETTKTNPHYQCI
jgi:hypothetical protein